MYKTHAEIYFDRRRPLRVMRIFGIVIVGVVFAAVFSLLFGWLVMLLWNWLMPSLFGIKTITYWQSFGITILAKILLSGVYPHSPHHSPRHLHQRYPRFHRWLQGEEGVFSGYDRFSRDEWKQYHSFWEEEGEAAFEAYLRKQDASPRKDDTMHQK